MEKPERMAIWTLLSLLSLGLLLTGVILSGELAALRRQVAAAGGTPPPPGEETAAAFPELPVPESNEGEANVWGSQLTVRALGARSLGATAVVSFTVRGSGAADPLLELPLLVCGDDVFEVEGDSLDRARRDLLALITAGAAETALHFIGAPNLAATCTLVLNPQQDAASPIAPRIEVPVPRQAPTPEPLEEE